MKYNTKKLLSKTQYSGLHQLTSEENKRIQGILLEICEDIYNFCSENALTCMLCGGSAIGAVRHCGFIPWDDDLDVAIPRDDYNYFIEHFEEKYGNKYKIYAPLGRHNATHLFAKVSKKGTLLEDIYTAGSKYKTGVAVDVFPMENVPKNKLIRIFRGTLVDIMGFLVVSEYYYENDNKFLCDVYSSSIKRKLIYKGRKFLGKTISFRNYQWWYRKYDSYTRRYKKTGWYSIPTGRGHYFGEIQKEETFLPTKEVDFEGEKFRAPADGDKYLSNLYGDYMTLPPLEKRERHYYTKIII